jgi:transglutaminase superfamily protein
MKRLRKLASLSGRERRVLAEAAVFLLLVECAVRVVPLDSLVARIQRARRRRAISAPGQLTAAQLSPPGIAWLVEVAARYSPLRGALRPTCLRRSLVLLRLLHRESVDARLVIGARSPQDGFEAHAWVEVNGEALGSQSPAGYHPLKVFESLTVARPLA